MSAPQQPSTETAYTADAAGSPAPADAVESPAPADADEAPALLRARTDGDEEVVEPIDVVTPGPPKVDEGDDDADEGDDDADQVADEADGEALLVREGDVAGDYLERLLDILDVDGDIDLDVEGDRASVAIVGGRLDDLIGPGGATLEALQELTRLAVAQSTGVRSRLMLDVGGFRAKRRADLSALAGETARRVVRSGQPERLSPMNPFERKVVHDVVAGIAGVHSESEGEEPNRRVVVLPDT